jgi:hypothetical protein
MTACQPPTAMQSFCAAISEIVHHPDYYKGPWYVYWRNGRKLCPNHATAVAWTKYLRRHDPDGWGSVSRAEPLPGFPRELSTGGTP